MRDIRDSSGQPGRRPTNPHPWLTATNPLTAAAVTSLMQAVVTSGTAATGVFPAAWNVAAKTGTAETGPTNNAHQRLDDRLRPGQRPEGGGGRGRAQPGRAAPRVPQIAGPPMKTILGDALAATP